MKNSRDKAIRQFLVLVALFPFCFLALREVVVAVLSAFSWDDTACAWVDGQLGLSGGDGRAANQSMTPERCGKRPDISCDRDGQHTACAYACVNLTPRRARASICGV